MKSRDVAEGEV